VFLEQNRRGAPGVCGAAAIQKSSAQRRNNLLSSTFGELIVRQCNLEQVSAGLNRYFPGCLDEGIWQH